MKDFEIMAEKDMTGRVLYGFAFLQVTRFWAQAGGTPSLRTTQSPLITSLRRTPSPESYKACGECVLRLVVPPGGTKAQKSAF